MPLQLTAVDRKILLVAAGVFVVMIGTAVLLVRGRGSDANIPSAYSAASGGCKAAFLLLKESGYQTQTWEQPLRELPYAHAKDKTLVILEPAVFPAREDKEKFGLFLRSGGRVIAAGRFANFYLPMDESAVDPLSPTTWKRIPALSPSPITRAAPEITLAPQAYWRSSSGAVGLYGEPEKAAVVEYKIGEGRVLWLAAATPLTNAGLKETGNLDFLLSALGSPEQTTILWDEYVHGYERSAASGKSNHLIAWIGLQLGVFTIAILLAYSRRNGPVWVPEGDVRLSPLEFVRTLGSLYEQANASGVAVEISFQRFRYMFTRRLGLPVNSSVDKLARAVREGHAIAEENFAQMLSECESWRYDARVPPTTALRLVQALSDYAVRLELTGRQRGEKKAWKQW